jgi:hypothetical protein
MLALNPPIPWYSAPLGQKLSRKVRPRPPSALPPWVVRRAARAEQTGPGENPVPGQPSPPPRPEDEPPSPGRPSEELMAPPPSPPQSPPGPSEPPVWGGPRGEDRDGRQG